MTRGPPPPPRQAKFATLPDDPVLSRDPKDLAPVEDASGTATEIKDLALSDNRLVGSIVPVGGVRVIGEKSVVIGPPLIAPTYDEGVRKWEASVNATRDRLEAAPEFKYAGKYED